MLSVGHALGASYKGEGKRHRVLVVHITIWGDLQMMHPMKFVGSPLVGICEAICINLSPFLTMLSSYKPPYTFSMFLATPRQFSPIDPFSVPGEVRRKWTSWEVSCTAKESRNSLYSHFPK